MNIYHFEQTLTIYSLAKPKQTGFFICPQEKVCDFEPDCPDASDERSCPREANFEACETEMGSPMCGFQEDPVDNLDWILASGTHSVAIL